MKPKNTLLKIARRKSGMKQQTFAKKINVSNRTLIRYEQYDTIPHPQKMKNICEILDLDINELIEDIEKYKGGLHAKKNKNNN
jgi:transcriptional regulator with XRE-family HTH domain